MQETCCRVRTFVSFSVKHSGYQMYSLLALFPTACGSGDDAAEGSQEPVSAMEFRSYLYRSYLVGNATELVDWVEQLRGQIAAGDLEKAQSRYATSRVQYGQIEPAAENLEALDTRIDALPGEVPEKDFGGFHRIEKALFGEETLAGMKPVAKQLLVDVEKLRRKLRRVDIQPEQIAAGANALLDEVVSSKLTGKEERYSQVDLVDVSANVEAAEAGFEALTPLLAENPALVESVGDQFKKVYGVLKLNGSPAREPDQSWYVAPGAVFGILDELPRSYVRNLSGQIEALDELLARVPSQLA